jgi:hypothetical protein
MRAILYATLLAVATPQAANAFCGFYAGKADASLFNEASQVIMVRDGRRTVITMLNDYKGALTEFALVVPVPVVLKQGDVRVADKKIFERIDAYSSPRLAEYYDGNPCQRRHHEKELSMARPSSRADAPSPSSEKAHGVTVEAQYAVGEYEIVILSAKQSDGLEAWLTENGYRIPKGASAALRPYIVQDMKFFVARVNLKEQAKSGATFLRPLQFSFESEKFMLPMRLGMINANGPQDLVVYALTRRGRVESTNYRTVKLPADVTLPTWLKSPGEFGKFYTAMFDQHAKRESYRAVFTEYVWDMGWCDPCAADPLSVAELKEAGVTWVGDSAPGKGSGAVPVVLTRLHLRYTKESFPEDLALQETGDRANYQTRYVIRHAWASTWFERMQCQFSRAYYEEVHRRQEREAALLASLTGWNLATIRNRMPALPWVW